MPPPDALDNAIDALPADQPPPLLRAPAPAPAPKPDAPDPLDAAIDSIGEEQAASLKNSLAIGATQEPARAAKVAALSDQLHLPPAVVDRNFDAVSQAAHLSSIDTDALHRAHPELAQWLSDPVNAALAHRDIPNLQHTDGAVALVNQVAGVEPDDPLPIVTGVIGRGARNAFRGLAMTVLSLAWAPAQVAARKALGITDAPSPFTPLGAFYSAHDLMAAENAARQTYAPSMLKDIATGVVTTVSDPTNVLVPLGAGAKAAAAVPVILSATREAAALKAAAIVQAELAGGEALKSGLVQKQERGEGTRVEWRDLSNAAAQTALGYVTGRASGLIGPLATLRSQPMALGQLPHDILANAILGGTQAAAGTAISDTLLEGKRSDVRSLVESYFSGALTGGLLSAANLPEAASVSRARALVKGAMDAHRAQADAAALAQAGVATQASETAKLAPDKYAALIKQMGGGAEAAVHFNQEQWDQHWTQTGGNPEAVADALMKKPGAYAEARATGADIAIPFSEYQARLANTDHYEPLLEHAKLDPEGMSLGEANDFIKKSPEAVNELMRSMIDEAKIVAPEHQAGADAVAKRIEEQLVAAGHDRGAAQTNAEAFGAMYQSLAKQVGSTPEEVAQRFPFDFSREMPKPAEAGNFTTLDAAIERVKAGDIPTQEDVRRSMQRIGLDSGDIIDDIKAIGGIKGRPAGNTGGEYEGRPNHPGINGTLAPDEVAKYLHDRGIGDGTVPTMYKAIEAAARARGQAKQLRHTPESQKLQAQRDYLLTLAKELEARGEDLTKSTSADVAEKHGATLEQPGKKDARAFIRINGQRFSIVLKPGADLTSVMHEAMHGFFEIMGHLAQDPKASPQLKADYQTLLTFSGYGTHENKLAMQAEHAALQAKIESEGREATPEERARIQALAEPHENIAKAFEQYLMDGKAPNVEMRSVFARFKAWFALVYKKMGQLMNLTPEVRGVFDRLVASEDQIKAAFVRSGDEGGLTREALGMTESQHIAYLEAVDAQREAAATDLRVELMATFQREYTARYQEERERVKEGVGQQVDERPEFAALRALQDGIMANGDVTPDGFKLNRRELTDRYGEDALYRLPGQSHKKRTNPNTGRNVYSKDGTLHLDDAAELFGFKSGDELWHALVNAPKREQVIEQETDAAMREQHPDPMTDGSIAERADAAAHGDKRGELLVREARALAKLANKEATPRQLMRVAALDAIGAKPIRDLKPHLYRTAEAKASRKAFEAAARGDHETAFAEKQRQILNHEFFKAATDAKAKATKQVDHLNDLSKPAARERIGKAGGWEWTVRDPTGKTTLVDTEAKAQALAKLAPGTVYTRTSSYLDQIDGLLARFGLGRKTPTSADSMAAFLAKQQEAGGVASEIPDAILDGSLRGDWRDMTVDQVGAVFDAAKAIEAAARQRNNFLREDRKATLSELAGSLAESMKENGPAARKDVNGHTPWSALTDTAGKIINFAKRVPDLCYRLDGFKYASMFWGWQHPINVATDREMARQAAATVRVSAMWDRWGKLGPKSIFAFHLHQKETIPEIGEGLNKFDQIMVAVNWGNAGNRERLMDGHKWTEKQVQAIIDRLDAKDVALVNEIHAHVNSFKSDIVALEQRVHGFAPDMVEATPFSGKGGEFTGGYFPIAYDNARSASQHVKNSDEQDITNMLAGRGAGSSYTAHQHTKERTASAGRPLNLDIGVFTNHLTKVIHDLELRETLIDANRLLRHPTFSKGVIDHLGKGAWDQFEAQLRGVAGGAVRTNTGMETVVGKIRQGANAARRAFNLAGSVKQLAGLPFIIPRVGLDNFARALVPAFSPAAHHWVEDNSVVMKYRNAERGKILNEELNRTSAFAPLGVFRDTAYFLYNKAWKLLDAHAWYATYYKAQADGSTEAEARAIADQGVADTQGATHQKDMAQMMRGGELAQVFTNNMSWASANFNMTALSIHRFLDRQGWRDPGEIAKLTSDMMVYLAVCPLVYAVVSEFMSGQDLKDWEDPKYVGKKLAAEGTANLLSMMPLAREAAPFLTRDNARWEGPQGTSALGELIAPLADSLHAAPKHPKPGPSASERDLVNLAGILFHFPSAQVLHAIDGWNYAEQQGLNPAWYTLMGKPPKKKK